MSFRGFAAEVRSRARDTDLSWVVLRDVDSTNLLARTVARRLDPEGGSPLRVLFVAWEQTAGRGRLGRSWSSAPGLGVYATLLLAPAPLEPPLSLLPLVAGIGLCEAVRRFVPGAGLKWPNDLVVGGRKLGGILIETQPASEGSQAALIGFGVNHGHGETDLPTGTATSVRLEGTRAGESSPTLGELLLALAEGLVQSLERHTEQPGILAAYRELSVHRPGDTLSCRVDERSIEGRFVDFDRHGRLRMRSGEEMVVLAAGDVVEGAGVRSSPEAGGHALS